MAKFTLMNELHVSIYASRGLRQDEYGTIRRSLTKKGFRIRLLRAEGSAVRARTSSYLQRCMLIDSIRGPGAICRPPCLKAGADGAGRGLRRMLDLFFSCQWIGPRIQPRGCSSTALGAHSEPFGVIRIAGSIQQDDQPGSLQARGFEVAEAKLLAHTSALSMGVE